MERNYFRIVAVGARKIKFCNPLPLTLFQNATCDSLSDMKVLHENGWTIF